MAKLGPTALAVAENLRRLRAKQRWSLRDVSDALDRDSPGWLSHVTLGHVERDNRELGVDELTALAAVFGVSPVTLLLPPDPPENPLPQRLERLTGTPEVTTARLLSWLLAERPLPAPDAAPVDGTYAPPTADEVKAFRSRALPWWASLPPGATVSVSRGRGAQGATDEDGA